MVVVGKIFHSTRFGSRAFRFFYMKDYCGMAKAYNYFPVYAAGSLGDGIGGGVRRNFIIFLRMLNIFRTYGIC